MITVIAFDRDLTVDVNFDPHEIRMQHGVNDANPVPLSTVKEYAHNKPRYDVWSHGNQHLRNEAEIYGIEEAKRLWEYYNGYGVENKYKDEGYHSYKPARREGLRLIRDVYEAYSQGEQINYVAVDDVPLNDMKNWDHYFAWDFVESEYAVEETEYTCTSVESKACNEEVRKNHINLDWLIQRNHDR